MNSNDHQLQTPEPLTRFCPGCGSVGPVDDKYRDCCPDGNTARLVPVPFAKHCKGLFDLALQNVAAPPSDLVKAAEEVMSQYMKAKRLDAPYGFMSAIEQLEAALDKVKS